MLTYDPRKPAVPAGRGGYRGLQSCPPMRLSSRRWQINGSKTVTKSQGLAWIQVSTRPLFSTTEHLRRWWFYIKRVKSKEGWFKLEMSEIISMLLWKHRSDRWHVGIFLLALTWKQRRKHRWNWHHLCNLALICTSKLIWDCPAGALAFHWPI